MTRQNKKKRLRFPMFVKFLIGCLLLAGTLIVGSTYVFQKETRLRARGDFMAKQLRRFHGYEERAGQALTWTTQFLAKLPRVVASLSPPPVDPAAPAPAPADPAKIAEELYDELSSEHGLQPELFALFDAAGRRIWAPKDSPLEDADLTELAAVDKAIGGKLFAHRPLLVDDKPYQVSAMPVKAGDRVVGGLVIGVELERYMTEFAEQSDDNDDRRIRVSWIDGTTVLASALPPDKRAELGKQAQPSAIVRVKVGDDVRDVIRTKAGDLDFSAEEIHAYRGLEKEQVGRLVVTRGRTGVVDPASQIPWLEIGIGIGLSVLVAGLMAFWITRPIKQFVQQSRDLLEGETDLNQRIVVNSADETADLADNINTVFGRVHALASEVQAAALQVGASSAEISAASKQTLGGLKDQTAKIAGSTAAVTELSASIQQVAQNAAHATDVAEKTNVAIGSAVERMQTIRVSVDDAAEKMRELGESSKRIGNIVEVIRQISEQTSMLALNASIEAAHAGEQGRGFAVVADEVSSLARRVGQSAKDIETLIQTVKEQTQAAMASMDAGTQEVETGSALVTSTLTNLGQLITVVKDTAHAVQEQAVVSDEIARNMDAVQHIATEVLTGSEESVEQAERLHQLAFQLEESIGGFNLDGQRLEGERALPARNQRMLPGDNGDTKKARRGRA